MAIAAYKDLCIDVTDEERGHAFWSAALGLDIEGSDDHRRLAGPTPQHTVWVNVVPEPSPVKSRVHVDLHVDSLDELVALGASVVEASAEDFEWTVMTDPDGGELCAFVRSDPPKYRLYEVAVDSVAPLRIATWWAEVWGAHLLSGDDEGTWWYVEQIPGCPFECVTFAPVPEPKRVKNPVHWDVQVDALAALVEAGATVLREQDDEISWTVLADPEGNEFCAFVRC